MPHIRVPLFFPRLKSHGGTPSAVYKSPDLSFTSGPSAEASVAQFPLNQSVDVSSGNPLLLKFSMSPSDILLYRFRPVVPKLFGQLVQVALRNICDPEEVLSEARIESRSAHWEDSMVG